MVIKMKSIPMHGNMNIKPIKRHLSSLNLETRDVGSSQATLRLHTTNHHSRAMVEAVCHRSVIAETRVGSVPFPCVS